MPIYLPCSRPALDSWTRADFEPRLAVATTRPSAEAFSGTPITIQNNKELLVQPPTPPHIQAWVTKAQTLIAVAQNITASGQSWDQILNALPEEVKNFHTQMTTGEGALDPDDLPFTQYSITVPSFFPEMETMHPDADFLPLNAELSGTNSAGKEGMIESDFALWFPPHTGGNFHLEIVVPISRDEGFVHDGWSEATDESSVHYAFKISHLSDWDDAIEQAKRIGGEFLQQGSIKKDGVYVKYAYFKYKGEVVELLYALPGLNSFLAEIARGMEFTKRGFGLLDP